MITHIKIQNFRSFMEAEVDLQPFSLVVGANGSGKTNLLKWLWSIALLTTKKKFSPWDPWVPHAKLKPGVSKFSMTLRNGSEVAGEISPSHVSFSSEGDVGPGFLATIFNLDVSKIAGSEKILPEATVGGDGSGTTAVLEMLKSGDREDLFAKIEEQFSSFVPEVEKLSLKTSGEGAKQIQVREKGLPHPLPATELSEGTRIILALLTIIHQESPPSMILLEDIDRGLHPRLFEYMAPLLRDIAARHDINIVATTHNPYLVDAMQDHKDAVIIVEKKDGASTLTTLASRLEGLDYDKVDPDDLPLGQLWFSGLVGGVPRSISSRAGA